MWGKWTPNVGLPGFKACIPSIMTQFSLENLILISERSTSTIGMKEPVLNDSLSVLIYWCGNVIAFNPKACVTWRPEDTTLTPHCSPRVIVLSQISLKTEPSRRPFSVSSESTRVTAMPKFSCEDCKMSDRCLISPTFFVSVMRQINLRSICANRALASTALSAFMSSEICLSRCMMAGSLSFTVSHALCLHAYRVSINLCNSLGTPWYMSLCTSIHLWCTNIQLL